MSFGARFWTALKEELAGRFTIGDMGEEISHAIMPRNVFTLSLGGRDLPVSDAVVGTWGVMLLLLLLALYLRRRYQPVPVGRQLVTEGLVGILIALCTANGLNEKQTNHTVPFVGSVALLITVANVISFVGILPPAKNVGYCFGLSILSVLFVVYSGFKLVGARGMWLSISTPVKVVLPFKVLDYLVRVMSLALRLFGNVFGAFILMEFIRIVLPVFAPGVFGLWFDLTDGILQAAIFTYLTVMYIGEIVEANHGQQVSMKEQPTVPSRLPE